MRSHGSDSAGRQGRAVDRTGAVPRGGAGLGLETTRPEPGRSPGLRSGLAPACCRRGRGGGDRAPGWFAPVAARAAGAVLDRSPADGVGREWPTVRLAHRGRAHGSPNGKRCDRPVQHLLAGAGDSRAGTRRRRRARASRPGAPGRPGIQPPSELVWVRRVPARAAIPGSQGALGAGRNARARDRPARPARAGNHC